MSELAGVFGAEGSLAAILPNYLPRPAQLAMAEAVGAAIAEQRSLIAEAGTGTGKTFAYLVPALLSGKRVMVSTGTRNLQDQLFRKDLPVIKKALGIPFQAALLKGRGNYLCHYRLENVLGFQAGYNGEDAAHLERLLRWSKTTRSGDIAEVFDVPESSFLWHSVTSTAENCLGQDCPAYARCCPAAARRKAQDADILVINHHLLWADSVLKSDGFGELLPQAEVVIVDEAHQFADTAAQFLGISVSSRQLDELTRDIQLELGRHSGDLHGVRENLDRLTDKSAALRLALGVGHERRTWNDSSRTSESLKCLVDLSAELKTLGEMLSLLADGHKGLDSCRQRTLHIQSCLDLFSGEDTPGAVRWFEVQRRGFRLNQTPIDIAGDFSEFYRQSRAAWVFTSATLSNAGRFDHFSSLLGLEGVETFCSESPFDYRRQCLLYIPSGLPDPASADYTRAVVAASLPLLAASAGRAFFLFTSHQAMNTAAEQLRRLVDYPLFIQGTGPKAALLELFKRSGNGILLGTASFWEGVDVRGPALSCVIIDKLPFAAPSDPVLSAQIQALKRRGQNPFRALQLPAAVVSLKQGVGRLIRDAEDRGVLMLCDPRLFNRSYGKSFLANLPEMRITRSIEEVRVFFRADDAAAGSGTVPS